MFEQKGIYNRNSLSPASSEKTKVKSQTLEVYSYMGQIWIAFGVENSLIRETE